MTEPNNDDTRNSEGEEEEEVYCICRRGEIPGIFMLACDKCEDWFHGPCVNVTEGQSKNVSQYYCPNCCVKYGEPPELQNELALPYDDPVAKQSDDESEDDSSSFNEEDEDDDLVGDDDDDDESFHASEDDSKKRKANVNDTPTKKAKTGDATSIKKKPASGISHGGASKPNYTKVNSFSSPNISTASVIATLPSSTLSTTTTTQTPSNTNDSDDNNTTNTTTNNNNDNDECISPPTIPSTLPHSTTASSIIKEIHLPSNTSLSPTNTIATTVHSDSPTTL